MNGALAPIRLTGAFGDELAFLIEADHAAAEKIVVHVGCETLTVKTSSIGYIAKVELDQAVLQGSTPSSDLRSHSRAFEYCVCQRLEPAIKYAAQNEPCDWRTGECSRNVSYIVSLLVSSLVFPQKNRHYRTLS